MCAVEPKGPYHIAGYSFGAIVALEIAQQLVASGRQVGLLGAIDSGPVSLYRNGEFSPSHLWSFPRNLCYWLIEDFLATHPRKMLRAPAGDSGRSPSESASFLRLRSLPPCRLDSSFLIRK